MSMRFVAFITPWRDEVTRAEATRNRRDDATSAVAIKKPAISKKPSPPHSTHAPHPHAPHRASAEHQHSRDQ